MVQPNHTSLPFPRWWCIILLAVSVFLTAHRTSGQGLQWDATTWLDEDIQPRLVLAFDAIQWIPGGPKSLPKNFANSLRPNSVEMDVRPANFDQDPWLDGWRAEILLRDQYDNVVSVPGRVIFELTTSYPVRTRQNKDRQSQTVRWEFNLAHSERGVTSYRLILKPHQRLKLGWPAEQSSRLLDRGDRTQFQDWKDYVGWPELAEMRVRVLTRWGTYQAVQPI